MCFVKPPPTYPVIHISLYNKAYNRKHLRFCFHVYRFKVRMNPQPCGRVVRHSIGERDEFDSCLCDFMAPVERSGDQFDTKLFVGWTCMRRNGHSQNANPVCLFKPKQRIPIQTVMFFVGSPTRFFYLKPHGSQTVQKSPMKSSAKLRIIQRKGCRVVEHLQVVCNHDVRISGQNIDCDIEWEEVAIGIGAIEVGRTAVVEGMSKCIESEFTLVPGSKHSDARVIDIGLPVCESELDPNSTGFPVEQYCVNGQDLIWFAVVDDFGTDGGGRLPLGGGEEQL